MVLVLGLGYLCGYGYLMLMLKKMESWKSGCRKAPLALCAEKHSMARCSDSEHLEMSPR